MQLTKDKLTSFIHFSHITITLELLPARTWAFDESFSLQVHVITTQTLCVSEMSFLYYVTVRGKLAQQCYDISLLDDDDVRNGKLNIWTVNLVTHIHSQCSNPALN